MAFNHFSPNREFKRALALFLLYSSPSPLKERGTKGVR
jgi:hypothetical protein